jgi:hypothetical protein
MSNPWSRVRAKRLGGPEWIGWTPAVQALAAQFDQIAALVGGLGGGELDQKVLYPKPPGLGAGEQEQEPIVPTIAQFNVPAFMRQVNS